MASQYSTLDNLKLDSKGLYRVGDKLGEGAQGAVFKVARIETGEDCKWAVKVTPFANPTRNRRSEAEINSRYLANERMMYQNSLAMYQGTMIPRTPNFKMKLQVYGQSEEGESYGAHNQRRTYIGARYPFSILFLIRYSSNLLSFCSGMGLSRHRADGERAPRGAFFSSQGWVFHCSWAPRSAHARYCSSNS